MESVDKDQTREIPKIIIESPLVAFLIAESSNYIAITALEISKKLNNTGIPSLDFYSRQQIKIQIDNWEGLPKKLLEYILVLIPDDLDTFMHMIKQDKLAFEQEFLKIDEPSDAQKVINLLIYIKIYGKIMQQLKEIAQFLYY